MGGAMIFLGRTAQYLGHPNTAGRSRCGKVVRLSRCTSTQMHVHVLVQELTREGNTARDSLVMVAREQARLM